MRTLLVGGVSGTHDALLAAALRGRGLDAVALPEPGAADLLAGRALLARGHCNPVYYLAGALVERLRAQAACEGAAPRDVAARFAHLTLGSCGPCRFASYAAEHARALAAAGFGDVPVAAIDQTAPGPRDALAALGVRVDGRLLGALVRAVVAGDVLVRAGCASRGAPGADSGAVDADIAAATRDATDALARRGSALPALAALRARSRRSRATAGASRASARPRVRLCGEFFASMTAGHGGLGALRFLESRGAAVEPPAAAEWLLYLAWAARDAAARREPPAPPPRFALAAERTVRRLYARAARAAGLSSETLWDVDDLAALAAPHYGPFLRGGMGHVEIGAFLAADRDGSAELFVSIKPFGCLPSSAVADGVLHALARRARRTRFVSIETTGDAEAQALSRLELALDGLPR